MKKIDLIVKIVLIIIIIVLLIKNCALLRENDKFKYSTPTGNIIEIKCDDDKCELSPSGIQSIVPSQKEFSVKKDKTIRLIPVIKPIGLPLSQLTWESSNPNIATVSEFGVVKGINFGTAIITIKSSNGKRATCIVKVTDTDIMPEEIKLIVDNRAITVGSTIQIIAKIIPVNATDRDLVWTSSDPDIATVDENGVVKGIKSGKVTITVMTKDGKVVANITITIEKVNSGDLNVYDDEHTSLTWNGARDLKIFTKSNGKIAPESSGTYDFIVKNTTIYNLKYQITFIETNDNNINMKYKLKKNDVYLIDHYVSASELNISNLILGVNKSDTYHLEWKWVSNANDTSIGTNKGALYGLKVKVEAMSTNG